MVTMIIATNKVNAIMYSISVTPFQRECEPSSITLYLLEGIIQKTT